MTRQELCLGYKVKRFIELGMKDGHVSTDMHAFRDY